MVQQRGVLWFELLITGAYLGAASALVQRVLASREGTPAERTTLVGELDRMRNDPVSAHELQRAKNQFARDYIVARETVQEKAAQLAHAVVIHNDIKTADGEFDIFQSITAADIQRVAKTYFVPTNRLVLTIMPKVQTQ